jgi:hypothetical protein
MKENFLENLVGCFYIKASFLYYLSRFTKVVAHSYTVGRVCSLIIIEEEIKRYIIIKGWNPFMGMTCLSVARSLDRSIDRSVCLPPVSL